MNLAIVITVLTILFTIIRFRNPFQYCLFIIASFPVFAIFYYIEIGTFSLIDITVGIEILIVLFLLISTYKKGFTFGRFSKIYIPFLLILTLATAQAIPLRGSPETISIFSKLILYYLVYLSFLNYESRDPQKHLILVLKIGFFFSLGSVVIQQIYGIGTHYSELSYQVGFYSNEGTLSRIGIVGLLISLPFIKNLRSVFTYYFLIFAGSVFFFLVAVSRNAILSGAAIIISYIFFTKRVSQFVIIGITLIVLIGGFWSSYQAGFEAKISKEVQYLSGDQSIKVESLGSGRIGRWERTLDEFKEGSLTTKLIGSGKGIGPHGQFLDLLRRSGILGLLITVVLFISIFRFYIRSLKRNFNVFLLQGFLMLLASLVLFFAASPIYEVYIMLVLFAFLGMSERQVSLKPIHQINNGKTGSASPGETPPSLHRSLGGDTDPSPFKA